MDDILLGRDGYFVGPEFDSVQSRVSLETARVLVVGAGGLGCELLKDLSLSGFRDIHVIDMDIVDLSNLNRQFLFRESDVGSSKAQVAARFINGRQKYCNLKFHLKRHFCRIEEKNREFYAQFTIVVSGLDAIEPRRWINNMMCSLVREGRSSKRHLMALIDGGTEGFRGNIRVVFPRQTACLECSLFLYPQQEAYPLCTISNTPRLPEHCVQYVTVVMWPKDKPGERLDGDNADHIAWVYERACARADDYGIANPDWRLTKGVVKNIIPAIASSNAMIAAACANEAVKIVTDVSFPLDNYMLYNGDDGAHSFIHVLERDPECPVCGDTRTIEVEGSITVDQFIKLLTQKMSEDGRTLNDPGILLSDGSPIYMSAPPALKKATEGNLERLLVDVTDQRNVSLSIADSGMTNPFIVDVNIKP